MIEDGNENAGMAKAGAALPESPSPGGLTAGELCDRICADYGVVSTVRQCGSN